jgi:transcription termination/antitermination protein NusG
VSRPPVEAPFSTDSLQIVPYSQPSWYAAYTIVRHEKRVAAYLQGIGAESFLPLYVATHHWNRRLVRVELPLFPGYVFVRIALADQLRVLRAPSVLYLVGTKSKPEPVADHQVESIRECLTRRLSAEPIEYLGTGRRVRVVAGPLSGLEGVIARQNSGARLIVSIDIIRRSIAINIEASDLELIETDMAIPA